MELKKVIIMEKHNIELCKNKIIKLCQQYNKILLKKLLKKLEKLVKIVVAQKILKIRKRRKEWEKVKKVVVFKLMKKNIGKWDLMDSMLKLKNQHNIILDQVL
jgi:hypothetical protein